MNITTMTAERNMEMFIMTTKNTGKHTTMRMLLKVRNFFSFLFRTQNLNLWTFSAKKWFQKSNKNNDVGRFLDFWPRFYMVVLGIAIFSPTFNYIFKYLFDFFSPFLFGLLFPFLKILFPFPAFSLWTLISL